MELLKETVKVNTSGSGYNIVFGDGILRETLLQEAERFDEPSAVIVSSAVYNRHSAYIDSALKDLSNIAVLEIDDSEINKNYYYAADYFKNMIDLGLNRNSCIVAIGGGVTGDFGGFLAALYMRGISVIQVPTTLLAMVDSSVGGKTAVNIGRGKNIIGAFHQPSLVAGDIRFLETLPYHELKNGIAEALKHGLIGDRKSFDLLSSNNRDTVVEKQNLIGIASASAAFKASVVEEDERESGKRAILNFGHTVGHALESYMKYSGVSHGEAVAFGIAVKTRICNMSGAVSDHELEMIYDIIDRYELVKIGMDAPPDELIRHMQYDKKNRAGVINFVGLNSIGSPAINYSIEPDVLRQALIETIRMYK